ncbi:hypothetical protein JCM10207_001212 [Rhodosporidiobolus poonsookiae]
MLTLARPAVRALPSLRATASASQSIRALHASPLARTTHPAHSSVGSQGVGEDVADTQRKNAVWPIFPVVGIVGLGYLLYANFYSGQQAREEKKGAKHDQAKSNPPAGSKENTGTRG